VLRHKFPIVFREDVQIIHGLMQMRVLVIFTASVFGLMQPQDFFPTQRTNLPFFFLLPKLFIGDEQYGFADDAFDFIGKDE
jgi:hypothetical protein